MSEWLNDLKWYVLQTKRQQESRTYCNLTSYGVEAFYPQVLQKHNTRSVNSWHAKPLFPGYVFAYFSISKMFHKIRNTRGVQKIVSLGANPCAIDDEIIQIMKSKIADDGFMRFEKNLKPGDRVTISKPGLQDFVGIFEYETKERDRVSILLTTVCYQMHVIVDKQHVSKIN